MSRERINEMYLNASPIEPPSDYNIEIKTEQSELSEYNTEINFEKSDVAESKGTEFMIPSISLRSEQGKENESNRRGDHGQFGFSSTVSVYSAKYWADAMTPDNHLINDLFTKVEKNEKCVICGKSTSISVFPPDVNQASDTSIGGPMKWEKNAVDNAEAQENEVCDEKKNNVDSSDNSSLKVDPLSSGASNIEKDSRSISPDDGDPKPFVPPKFFTLLFA